MFSSKMFLNDHCTVKNKQPQNLVKLLYIFVCLSAFFDYTFVLWTICLYICMGL